MSVKAEANASGIGFFGLLAIVFITLKLTDVIDWSWWWVLSPIWGPVVVFFSVVIFVLVFSAMLNSPRKKL